MYGILAELLLTSEIFELLHILDTPSTPDWTSTAISINVNTYMIGQVMVCNRCKKFFELVT